MRTRRGPRRSSNFFFFKQKTAYEIDQPPPKCRLRREILGERQHVFRFEIDEQSLGNHQRAFGLRAHALKQRAPRRLSGEIGPNELHPAAAARRRAPPAYTRGWPRD